jgi:SAM-dependent methyltransferase
MSKWWVELYDDTLAEFLMDNRTPEEVTKSINFIEKKLQIQKGDLIFDQCCGTGSLSNPLGEAGYSVIGVDQAATYIARAEARRKSGHVKFITADAFAYKTTALCDAGINWWTSFGYTMDDTYNQKMLIRAAESLRKGAHFMLDTMNLPGVFGKFSPEVVSTIDRPEGKVSLRRLTQLDWKRGAMLKKWIFEFPDGERKETESEVRLYMTHTLVEMMEQSGFKVLDLYGSEEGEPLQMNSMRCIILAERV